MSIQQLKNGVAHQAHPSRLSVVGDCEQRSPLNLADSSPPRFVVRQTAQAFCVPIEVAPPRSGVAKFERKILADESPRVFISHEQSLFNMP